MYRWEGTGPKIILLHGWDSNSFRWRPLLPYLAELNADVYAFDAFAHGLSSGKKLTVPRYTEIVRQVLTIIPAKFLIGHSMGGMTAIYNQYLHKPPSIEKIICLGAPSELSTIMATYQSMLGYSERLMTALENRIITRFNMKIADFSMAKFAKSITVPGLIIHDNEDTTADLQEGRDIANNWTKATFMKTDGLGHRLQDKEVYETVVEFIKNDVEER